MPVSSPLLTVRLIKQALNVSAHSGALTPPSGLWVLNLFAGGLVGIELRLTSIDSSATATAFTPPVSPARSTARAMRDKKATVIWS